jgi:hypothetical protein
VWRLSDEFVCRECGCPQPARVAWLDLEGQPVLTAARRRRWVWPWAQMSAAVYAGVFLAVVTAKALAGM